MKQLVLGIPKGSLQESTINLFRQSGWRISLSDRNYFPEINDPEISCAICRAQEMSRYVEQGTFDVGLTGRDWIMENDSEVTVVADLIYSKVSQRPARWPWRCRSILRCRTLKICRERRSPPNW